MFINKKNILMMMIGFLLLVSLSITVNGYEWTCLDRGESLEHQDYTCNSDCCRVCTNNGWSAALYRCNDAPQCGCDGGQNGELDLNPPTIIVNSPVDGGNYRSAIIVDITSDESASLYYDIEQDRYDYRTLTSTRVTDYNRLISFPEGLNTVRFKGKDYYGNEGYYDVEFTVDTKDPRFSGVEPRSGTYTNGDFTVEYSEKNNDQTTLHVLQDEVERTFDGECPDGDNQICEISATDLQEGDLEYWFTICDPVLCLDSEHNNVMVDTVDPVLTMNDDGGLSADGYYGSRSITFGFDTDELVTLEYLDHSSSRPSWRSLGRDKDEFLSRTSFADGEHNVDFRATDKAGNTDLINHVFKVDSKKPRINSESPRNRGHGFGEFEIEYTEDNVKQVSLYYMPNGDDSFTVLTKNDCPTGTDESRGKASCVFEVSGLTEGPLFYYFGVADYATEVLSRRQSEVNIDTVVPELELVSFTTFSDTPYLASRSVTGFDFEVSEDVTITYIDHADTRARERRLCGGCDEYKDRSLSFRDGYHDVEFFARDLAGNEDTYRTDFIVDSKVPRITLEEPRTGKYGNGEFKVDYLEENVKSVTLFYNDSASDSFTAVKKTDCPSGTTETRGKNSCVFNVGGLPQGDLSYYFAVEDHNTEVLSRRQTLITIDTVVPSLIVNLPTADQYERYVNFDLESDEAVSLSYVSNNDPTLRKYTLCSNCLTYVNKKYFQAGDHDITITAEDKAGNKVTHDVSVTVV